MLFDELSTEEIIAVCCEEAREDGLEEGLEKGHEDVFKLLEQGLSVEEIKHRLAPSNSK